MNIQEQSYKELCKQFSEAVIKMNRQRKAMYIATALNLAAFIANLVEIILRHMG